MMDWAVLFDLDGTLVESSRLKPLRDARRWPQVYGSLALSELQAGTREMLAATAEFAQIGVITMAPRTYAERLLRYHDLAVPVLVAYHDVIQRIARHYQTGARLRAAQIDQLVDSRLLNPGLEHSHRLFLATFDAAVHSGHTEKLDLEEALREAFLRTRLAPYPEGTFMRALSVTPSAAGTTRATTAICGRGDRR